jgi:hypothetical protein
MSLAVVLAIDAPSAAVRRAGAPLPATRLASRQPSLEPGSGATTAFR